MLNIALIGYGYWGPNIARNIVSCDNVNLATICDIDSKALDKAYRSYSVLDLTLNSDLIFEDPTIDAVAIITPTNTHYELAKKALLNGKHVFVEKPFTQTSAQAEELIEISERANKIIMVDHTFVFTGVVSKIRDLIQHGELGSLYYYDATRINLGLFQHDTNVVWDLAPHDFSILNFLVNKKPVAVSVTGKANITKYENVAYITVHYNDNFIAHVNVNWLSPVKVRQTFIAGEKKMIMWDDVESDEKLRVYDRGVIAPNMPFDSVSYRFGDAYVPKISQAEALKSELNYFFSFIEKGQTPSVNNAYDGLLVVKMLEACDESLSNEGTKIYL